MSALSDLYQQVILDHAKERHGNVPLASEFADDGWSTESHQVNPTCGDEITLRVTGTGDTIRHICWEGDGCSISMASASVLHDMGEGLTREELQELTAAFRDLLRSRGTMEPDEEVLGDAAAFAGVARYSARVKCAMLAWVAAEDALR